MRNLIIILALAVGFPCFADETPLTRLVPINQPAQVGLAQDTNRVALTSVRKVAAEAVEHAAKNAVIVRVSTGGGMGSRGSGVYLGDKYVATAYHVIDEAIGPGTVQFRDQTTMSFRVVGSDPVWDQAILELDQPHPSLPGVEIAAENPQPGQTVYSVGFGQGFRIFGGPVEGYSHPSGQTQNDTFYHRSPAVSGDSGGPIFETSGRLLGCLWGSDGRSTYGSVTGRFHLLCKPLFPRLAAWRNGRSGFLNQPGCDTGQCPPASQPGLGSYSQCPDGQCPPQTDPGLSLNPPSNGPAGPTEPIAGPVGPAGPAGPAGPVGPKGDPAEVTPEQIEQIKSELLAAMLADGRFRGKDGMNGDPGSAPTPQQIKDAIDAYIAEHPEQFTISLALVDENGTELDRDSVLLGGTLKLQFYAKE